jgi:hypothetical protein
MDRVRPNLAATETANPIVNRAIAKSFLSGYRLILSASIGILLEGRDTHKVLSPNRAPESSFCHPPISCQHFNTSSPVRDYGSHSIHILPMKIVS